jgi:hypothetical protein
VVGKGWRVSGFGLLGSKQVGGVPCCRGTIFPLPLVTTDAQLCDHSCGPAGACLAARYAVPVSSRAARLIRAPQRSPKPWNVLDPSHCICLTSLASLSLGSLCLALQFAFARAVSRLLEMQSERYASIARGAPILRA